MLEIVNAFEQACGRKISYHFASRRPGDLAAFWVDPTKAREELGWFTRRDLKSMMEDVWRLQQGNPEGYV